MFNAPLDYPTNQITLAAGDAIPIPRGSYLVSLGSYCILQFLDPVNGTWSIMATAASSGQIYLESDGFNFRVANMTGCPVGALVNNYGAGGYVQASTTVAVAGGGGSTWQPLVGGQIVMTTSTIVTANSGAGHGVAPMAFLPAPPGPSNNANGVGGIQASGFCTISSGTVSGFTLTNPGAGYPSAATYTIVTQPNPTDPNINTGITNATLAFSVTGSGSLTGVLCTNPGAPLSTPNNITLTVSGAGTQATVSAIMMQTVVTVSVVGGSTIVGATGAGVTSVGGYPQAAGPATPITGTITNGPQYLIAGNVAIGGAGGYGLWARPRPLAAQLTAAAGVIAAQTGIIYDGGLFYGVPVGIIQSNAFAALTGSGTVALTMGSRPDIVVLQTLSN